MKLRNPSRILRKALALTLAAALCAGCTLQSACAEETPSAYWRYQSAMSAAVKSDDVSGVLTAAQGICDAYADQPDGEDKYLRVADAARHAANAAERAGDLELALSWARTLKSSWKWLENYDFSRYDFSQAITLLEARIAALADTGEIYTLTDQSVSYQGAVNEPESGTYYGSVANGIIQSNESAVLFYDGFGWSGIDASYWVNMYSNLYAKVKNAAEGNAVIEFAWNAPGECSTDAATANKFFQEIYNGKYDDEINGLAATLGSLNTKVMLRLFAEVNCWGNLPEPYLYVLAFRHIANIIHARTDNVAIVYSPNIRSSLEATLRTYYPGDDCVDWVGCSLYAKERNLDQFPLNSSLTGASFYSSGALDVDAYYAFMEGTGYDSLYSSLLLQLNEFVDEFGDSKPLMLSECGMSCGTNVPAATAIMENLYTYVNMAYPQIKLICYFDHDPGGSEEQYKFSFSNSASYYQAYRETTAANPGLLDSVGDTTVKNYAKLTNLSAQKTDSLTVYTYAQLPVSATADITCTYTLDGKAAGSTADIPYACTLSLSGLSAGVHTLTAKVSASNYWGNTVTRTVTRSIVVLPDSTVEGMSVYAANYPFTDIDVSSWYSMAVLYAYQQNLFSGTSVSPLAFSPDQNMSRAMLVTVLWRLEGKPAADLSAFSDVSSGAYYAGAVAWAASHGIVTGMDGGLFAPNDPVTREQMAAILYRYAKYKGYKVSGRAPLLSAYPDYARIDDYALQAVSWANANGFLTGSSENGSIWLLPRGNATRAQVAAILMRFIQAEKA